MLKMKFPAETVKFSTGNAIVLCPALFPRCAGYALIIDRWNMNHLLTHAAAPLPRHRRQYHTIYAIMRYRL